MLFDDPELQETISKINPYVLREGLATSLCYCMEEAAELADEIVEKRVEGQWKEAADLFLATYVTLVANFGDGEELLGFLRSQSQKWLSNVRKGGDPMPYSEVEPKLRRLFEQAKALNPILEGKG